jgi:hypothetical protein
MVDGKRVQLGSAKVEVDISQWHELTIKQTRNHIHVEFDQQRMLSIVDDTYPDAGWVGLYAKADSTTAFADVRITAGVTDGIVFFDSLKNETIGRQTGGKFMEGGGWTLTKDGDRIIWNLPPMPVNGMVEVDVRNLNPPEQATAAHNIFLGLWGTLFENREKMEDQADQIDCDNYEIRMGTSWGLKFKTEYHASGSGTVQVWEPLKSFDPQHTYHLKVEWRDGKVTTWLDDHKLEFGGEWKAPLKGMPAEPMAVDLFNFFHLGTSVHFGGKGTVGPIYSNVKVTAFGSGK